MKIRIECYSKKGKPHYRADCLDLPGSPPCGDGKTQVMAIAHLMYLMINSSTYGFDDRKWHTFLKSDNVIEVNGKKWERPYKAQR